MRRTAAGNPKLGLRIQKTEIRESNDVATSFPTMEGDGSRPVPIYRGIGREVLEEGEPIDGQDPPLFPGWMSADDPATVSFNDTIWKAMEILEKEGVDFSALELFASSIGPTITISCAVIPAEVDDIVLTFRETIYPTDLFPKDRLCRGRSLESPKRAHYHGRPLLACSLLRVKLGGQWRGVVPGKFRWIP